MMSYILVSKIKDGHKVFESLYYLAELCRGVLVLENNDCFMIQGSGRMQLYIPYMLRCRRVRKLYMLHTMTATIWRDNVHYISQVGGSQ